MTTPLASSSASSVTIHVCDEKRGVRRDFSCARGTLLREMRYFGKFLEPGASAKEGSSADGGASKEEVDISVHCDIKIFEWLMRYAKAPKTPPPLSAASVISILVSSDFLEMESLVTMCLEYVQVHTSEIMQLPIDLSCLNRRLVTRMSDMLSDSEIEAMAAQADILVDRAEGGPHAAPLSCTALVEQCYCRRVEVLLRRTIREAGEGHTAYARCSSCGMVYNPARAASLTCAEAEVRVDFRGRTSAPHVAAQWDPASWVRRVRDQQTMTWRRTWWQLWALGRTLPCGVCAERYVVAHAHRGCAHFSAECRAALAQIAADALDCDTGEDEGRADVAPCCGSLTASALRLVPQLPARGGSAELGENALAVGAASGAAAQHPPPATSSDSAESVEWLLQRVFPSDSGAGAMALAPMDAETMRRARANARLIFVSPALMREEGVEASGAGAVAESTESGRGRRASRRRSRARGAKPKAASLKVAEETDCEFQPETMPAAPLKYEDEPVLIRLWRSEHRRIADDNRRVEREPLMMLPLHFVRILLTISLAPSPRHIFDCG